MEATPAAGPHRTATARVASQCKSVACSTHPALRLPPPVQTSFTDPRAYRLRQTAAASPL